MSHQSFLSDAVATRDRGEWLAELYIKDPAGVEVILRFSYRGTSTGVSAITIGSDTIAAHTPFRKRLMTVPTLTQSLWQSGKILSSSLPSFGNMILTNADGGLDQYHPKLGYQWSGCRCKIYFCDYLNIQDTIGKTFDGYLGTPDFSIPAVDVPLKGREDLFEVPISSRVYRGTSYMLEIFGDRTISYGTPAAVNITGSMTVEGWIWFDGLPTTDPRRMHGWFGGTKWPWQVRIISTGKLSLGCTISSVEEVTTMAASVSVKKPYHLSVTVSGRNVTFCLYDDDTQTEVIETFMNGFSTATRDAQVGGTYVTRSASDATLTPWFDEWRVWNVARTLAEIRADRFRPLDTNIPATCVHRLGFDDGSGTTVTDSSASAAHGTISGAGTSTWLWAHEGGPELAGTPKDDVWGEKWGMAPVLVDPVRQGYQVVGGGGILDVTTYEGGLSHTMDATAASFRAYITTTPVAGHSLRYLARGLFKLGSSPTLPISAYVKGYNGGALGYVNGGRGVSLDIITRRGPKLVDPTDLDSASFTAYGTANPYILGLHLKETKNISEALNSIMSSGAGWWGYVRASNLFHIEKYSGPAVTADYNFTGKNIISIQPMPAQAVVYKVVVKYRHNEVVHSEDQVAASVKGTAGWSQWTREWQEQSRQDDEIRAKYPGSESIVVTFETLLQYQADAGLLADYLLALLKGEKIGYVTTTTAVGIQSKIGQTATATMQIGADERLGLDGIDKFSILTVVDDPQNGTVKHELWGNGSV